MTQLARKAPTRRVPILGVVAPGGVVYSDPNPEINYARAFLIQRGMRTVGVRGWIGGGWCGAIHHDPRRNGWVAAYWKAY